MRRRRSRRSPGARRCAGWRRSVPSTRSGAPIAERMNPSFDSRSRIRFASRRLACASEADRVVGHRTARSASKTAPPNPSPGASSYAGPPDPTPVGERNVPGDFSNPSAGSLISTIPVDVSGKISRQASRTAEATEVTSRATPSLRPRVAYTCPRRVSSSNRARLRPAPPTAMSLTPIMATTAIASDADPGDDLQEPR